MCAYELQALKLPKMSGKSLKLFTAFVENPIGRALSIKSLLKNGGIPKLRKTDIPEAPQFLPLVVPSDAEYKELQPFQSSIDSPQTYRQTARKISNAITNGDVTVSNIAATTVANIQASDTGLQPLRAFIAINTEDVLDQAEKSQKRYLEGKPLSLLDGVPVAIKDEIDMLPYPTTVGTAFLGKQPACNDSTVVARLRAAGALLVGKANMHEIGINPNGANVNFGVVRNPYQPLNDSGGSSSGSAAAVSAGLVPIAIGADGGGSIRIPAALCGIIGLKATYGRISEYGAAPLCWSVAHLGPLAATVEDTALSYSIIAGPDEQDINTLRQPAVTLKDWNKEDLRGVNLGIYRRWFEHADSEIVDTNLVMLDQMVRMGAHVHEIEIPQLDEMRIAHAVTILAEMALCMRPYRDQRKLQGGAVRLSLVLGEELTASDYIQAQRMRARAMIIFKNLFKDVDVILTPATAKTSRPIPVNGNETGWTDLATDTEMMRFIFPGNLVGMPAISFPIGYDSAGLPIGMQAIGCHWQENLLLRVAFNAERVFSPRIPDRYFSLGL